MTTVLPCQCGEWASKSLVPANTYQRTCSPLCMVSARRGAEWRHQHEQGRFGRHVRGEIFFSVPAVFLVILDEHYDEFAIHALRSAVGLGLAARSDDHRSDQPCVGIAVLVDMGVIHPQHGIDVAGGGASALRNLPRVFVGATGRDAVVGFVGAGGSVFVGRAFGVFVVEDAVWMHGVGALGVVAEDLICLGSTQEARDGAGCTWRSISETFPERLDTSRS